jgi:hypothetical protein
MPSYSNYLHSRRFVAIYSGELPPRHFNIILTTQCKGRLRPGELETWFPVYLGSASTRDQMTRRL